MRIAVIGPTHPYKGGVAQYTTELAHRLAGAGHRVSLVSWSHQYPKLLYPGQLTVARPEVPLFPGTTRPLSWRRPDSWYRVGRRLRDQDLVVLVVVTPIQMPAYLGILAGLGRRRTARVVAQCHNVLPHERRAVDVRLVRAVLSRVDGVLVHSPAEEQRAREVTTRPVLGQPLAPLVVASGDRRPAGGQVHRRLLFFGLVRPYKGLDVLLRALAGGPAGVRLRVAGEFWGGPQATRALVSELGLADRVELRPGYVDAADVPALFEDVDALVLPYRSATGSVNAYLGFEQGVPVIATRTGSLAHDIRDGVDGLLCQPDDVAGLAAALHAFYADGVPQTLRAAVPAVAPDRPWQEYTAALLLAGQAATASGPVTGAATGPETGTATGPVTGTATGPATGTAALAGPAGTDPMRGDPMAKAAPPGGALLAAAKRAAEQVLWTRVGVQRRLEARRYSEGRPLPRTVPPTDLLRTRAEWQDAVAECRRLRLPLHHDRPKNWDALGAVSMVLERCGPGSSVLDAGSARYSSVLPWLRLYGFSDLVGINLEFGPEVRRDGVRFRYGDITATDFPDGRFDAVTCMSVVEHGVPLEPFLAEAARILRPGGLLVVSTDYDQDPPDTSRHLAYGQPVHIFSPTQVKELVGLAGEHQLDLLGELPTEHPERPVYWKRIGLHYTFIRLSFRKRAAAGPLPG
jgi:glycosyltransferase involved in cell wall biosynthesis/SAM-dependent methyltransferase